MTVAGNLALIPYRQPRGAGAGLIAVDLTNRRIAWNSTVAANSAQSHAWTGHQVYADATRGRALRRVRADAGHHRLRRRVRTAAVDRAGPGDAGDRGQPGRLEHRHVAGGADAGGCGAATCRAQWTKTFPSGTELALGATDGTSLYVSYRKPAPANSYGDQYAGVLARLSVTNGAQQWTTTLGDYVTPAVRGGNVVWVINEYRTSAGALGYRILGFSATGTSASPLVSIPVQQRGFPQSLAVGEGPCCTRRTCRSNWWPTGCRARDRAH
ncbi:hypothetical protein [Blastococcus sp. SYSU D00820]